MARPRTALGSWGTVRVVGQVQESPERWQQVPAGAKATRWRARTRVRDLDGRLRDVERYAATRARAEAALKAALSERTAPRNSATLRAEMTFADAGAVWLRQIARAESGLAATTVAQYQAAWARHAEGSTLASMSLREANRVPAVRTFLEGVADVHGSGSAKTARTVVSLVLGMAVRDGLFDVNAAQQVRTPKASGPVAIPPKASTRTVALAAAGVDPSEATRDTRRALTPAERKHLLALAATDEAAKHGDVADLARFMAGTGVRISEALGQAWADADLKVGTVYVRGTKTDASRRTLWLPPWLVEVLRTRRQAMPRAVLVFPSPKTGGVRDRRNAARHLRALLDTAGLPWATPHSLRRTVASMIDEAGLPIALAANQLGHADAAMTARGYLGRKGDNKRAAAVL